MNRSGTAHYFLLSLALLALDQLTKYIVTAKLTLFQVIEVLPFFNIVYVQNTGSAFGLFKGLGNAFFVVVALLAICAVSFMIVRYRPDRLPLALVLGGAAGNLTDRIRHGYVVDFLDFFAGRHHWPSFNVADSALTVGIAILLVRMLLSRETSENPPGK